MSDKRVRRPVLVPRLRGDALDWVERALAIGRNYDYRTIIGAFVDTFPYFIEDILEDTNVSEATVRKILKDRFKKMRSDKRRSSYHRIKAHQKRFRELFEDPFIAMVSYQAIELEKCRQIPTLTVVQRLKIFDAAHKIEDAFEAYYNGISQYC